MRGRRASAVSMVIAGAIGVVMTLSACGGGSKSGGGGNPTAGCLQPTARVWLAAAGLHRPRKTGGERGPGEKRGGGAKAGTGCSPGQSEKDEGLTVNCRGAVASAGGPVNRKSTRLNPSH